MIDTDTGPRALCLRRLKLLLDHLPEPPEYDYEAEYTRAALSQIVRNIARYGLRPAFELLAQGLNEGCYGRDIMIKAVRCADRYRKCGVEPEDWVDYFDAALMLTAAIKEAQVTVEIVTLPLAELLLGEPKP